MNLIDTLKPAKPTAFGALKGFTLLELMIVISMIAIIVGALSTSVSSAQERARVQKATTEVKSATQAILAFANFKDKMKLDTMTDQDADSNSLGFLLGNETSSSGAQVPVLLQAALSSGGKWRDPWGTPYKVTIREGQPTAPSFSSLKTSAFLPNMYRLSRGERQ